MEILDQARFALTREELVRVEIKVSRYETISSPAVPFMSYVVQARQMEFKLLKRINEEKMLKRGNLTEKEVA